MNRFFFAAALTVLSAASALPQQAPPPPPPPAVTQPAAPAATVPGGLNLNNASLLEVINLLAQDLHINYILDASVKGGSVTINTFGAVRDVDLRPLLETILRMNNLAMVQVGNIYRIIPAANVARQPVSPTTEIDPSKLPDDERLVLNLVFLRYMTSSEMAKVLSPFLGEGAQLTNYDPANLLIILDNSRNMRRTLEMIALFDSDNFAGQRVRAYDVKNGRPSDITKELDDVFRAYSLTGGDGRSGAVRFIALDRINTILAVAPNPGAFIEVDKWVQKLDSPTRATAGAVDNYVYKLKYGRAEIIGGVIMQLYGMPGAPAFGATQAYAQNGYGQQGGYGQGGYGTNGGVNTFGTTNPAGVYGGGYPGGNAGVTNALGGAAAALLNSPAGVAGAGSTNAALGTATVAGLTAPAPRDQTGTFLAPATTAGAYNGPRIIPNQFDNTLLVLGTPQQWEQIKRLLDQLDLPPRQVLIDAKIYEVDLTGDFSLGVESALAKAGSAAAGFSPNHQLLGSNTSAANQLTLSAGALVGQSRQLLALLQASESRTRAKVLSAPSVVATDSIPASITVGDSVPTLTSQGLASGVQAGGNSLFTNTVSNTSTGIGLNILARINPSGVVTMVINQSVTAPQPTTTSNIDSPSFSQRSVQTQVTVEDGDTVAIGGIITESATDVTAGIPWLNRLPYVGFLFGTKSTTLQRTELIVFLTPRVIYDTTQMTDATEELKEKVKGLRKIMSQNP